MRKEKNKELLRILDEIVEACPDLRFGQILMNWGFVDWGRKPGGTVEVYDPFYEEPDRTLSRVKKEYYGEDKV
jgi:hypothetical protein